MVATPRACPRGYYFRKKVKKDSLIDVDCIPPYDTTIRSAKELLSKFDDLIGLDGIKEELEKPELVEILQQRLKRLIADLED